MCLFCFVDCCFVCLSLLKYFFNCCFMHADFYTHWSAQTVDLLEAIFLKRAIYTNYDVATAMQLVKDIIDPQEQNILDRLCHTNVCAGHQIPRVIHHRCLLCSEGRKTWDGVCCEDVLSLVEHSSVFIVQSNCYRTTQYPFFFVCLVCCFCRMYVVLSVHYWVYSWLRRRQHNEYEGGA